MVQREPPSERVFSVRLGAEVPLINTCSGHILLAFSDKQQYQTMLNKIPEHHLKPEEINFRKIMDRVNQQGYENIQSAQAQGLRDIGYPIFDHNGVIAAVLAIPFLEYLDGSHKVDIIESQEKIKKAAINISRGLGYELNLP